MSISDEPYQSNLVTYAFLAQATRTDDVITGLMPIFAPIARPRVGSVFDPAEFSRLVAEYYGLKVPTWAVEDFVPRLLDAGILNVVNHTAGISEHRYAPIEGEFDSIDKSEIDSVLQAFLQHSKPLLEQLNLKVDKTELSDGFLKQLVNPDFSGVLLKPDVERTTKLRLKKKGLDEADTLTLNARMEVLCASFIHHAYRYERPLYDLIEKIAAGALIAEVVLNFQSPNTSVSLSNLTVILDTPILMMFLGLDGEDEKITANEFVDLLRERGANCAAFQHSAEELSDNIKSAFAAASSGYLDRECSRRIARDRAFAQFATAIRNDAVTALDANEIQVIRPALNSRYAFFTGEEEEEFAESLGFMSASAAARDAKSVAEIVRLRGRNEVRMSEYHDAEYLLVTQNAVVAKRSKEFCVSKKKMERNDMPPALNHRYLAGLLWVSFGGTDGTNLARSLLLSNCVAATQPRADVIRHTREMLDKSDKAQRDLFSDLLGERRAAQYLMERTLGDAQLVTQENVGELLEGMKESLIADQKHGAQVALQKEREKHSEEKEEIQSNAEELRQRLERERLDTEGENLELHASLAKLTERIGKLELGKDMEREQKENVIESLVSEYKLRLEKQVWAGYIVLATVPAIFAITNSNALFAQGAIAVASVGINFLGYWTVPSKTVGRFLTHRCTKYKAKLLRIAAGNPVV